MYLTPFRPQVSRPVAWSVERTQYSHWGESSPNSHAVHASVDDWYSGIQGCGVLSALSKASPVVFDDAGYHGKKLTRSYDLGPSNILTSYGLAQVRYRNVPPSLRYRTYA